ncbi:dihydrodipicolinate reductase [Palleronia caenipelagi]|uniref:Dihydrodipicolinate reductase n=1 Tax=Palleronia caenipelagi TaxID=2489174 RepID=A0A547Q780_9RHOB|nr:dihydrodipicolinate reductase [Palleronia caenipelagi]TRD22247.1 dihydrodipicolinate reductase [Palleronia caenipelagi]
MTRLLLLIWIALFPAYGAGQANQMVRINDAKEFREQVAGRDLTRTGITMRVEPGGVLTGRAFGGRVTGRWTWESGYFCREMRWGGRSWDWNCQAVFLGADTVRFIADRGKGDSADLSLK